MGRGSLLALCVAALALLAGAAPAGAATVSASQRFTASDGVTLQTTISGAAPLAPRPVVVEFSPYGRNSQTVDPGPDFNLLLVQDRGTGDSDGTFDALGPRSQADVAEVLGWACHQPWSDGRLGLNGFSASAILVYNALHLELPCVKAAVLRSGTFELYRDLLYPGGISNLLPGAGVMALIGAPALEQGGDRMRRDPVTGLVVATGLLGAGASALQHPQLDGWWRERGFRGDANHLPVLMLDGFFDVESRGAFQAFQALRRDGAHLLVVGGHDGAPTGTDGGAAATRAWFDHYVRGVANGAARGPRVRMLLSQGDREDYLHGRFTRVDAANWPVPGTRWARLALGPGTLTLGAPARASQQAYAALPSYAGGSDPPNAAIVGAAGFNALFDAMPVFSDATLARAAALTYRTVPLRQPVEAAGPLDLDLRLASTAPQTDLWAVLCDVSADGTAHPLTAGRLNSDFPAIDRARSLVDRRGDVVQPYGRYDDRSPAAIGRSRLYHVELWPVGNRFGAGHRIELEVVGASAASLPGAPAVNAVTVGGRSGSRLLFPVLPGSDLRAALRRQP